MAVGLGYMTGFSLPRNFEQPYSSQSITEFWRRWHISPDSFGDLASEVFAGAFRSVIQVNVNDLSAGNSHSQVIDRVRSVERVDRLIFVIQEGNVPALAGWR